MAEWQTRDSQKVVRVIPHEGSTPFLGTLPLTEKMGKEAKVTLKDFKELALFTIEDSVSAYYRAKKGAFFRKKKESFSIGRLRWPLRWPMRAK